MSASAVDFERILAGEGLAPIDQVVTDQATVVGGRVSGPRRSASTAEEKAAAIDAWTGWARRILSSHAFTEQWDRVVWSLYSDGKTLTEIETALHMPRRSITRSIARVLSTAPPPPVVNPWRKSGRGLKENHFVSMLRELLDGEKEIEMAEAKLVHYDMIRVAPARMVTITRPRIGRVDRDIFVDVEGRPHAGGIDIEVETKAKTGEPTLTTITLPWSMIRQADRSRPDEAAGQAAE